MRQIIAVTTVFLISVSALAETKLSWETKDPKNSSWTGITITAVEKYYDALNLAEDINIFCPNFDKLGKEERITVWGEFFSALSYYESGWNQKSQYTEIYLGIDNVTGRPLVSEGLLQLSYADTRWATWCPFNWEQDKNIPTFDTTILNPKNNLECGIGILARQTKKHKKIILEKGAYWSTLRPKGYRNKVDEMSKMMQTRLKFCIKSKALEEIISKKITK